MVRQLFALAVALVFATLAVAAPPQAPPLAKAPPQAPPLRTDATPEAEVAAGKLVLMCVGVKVEKPSGFSVWSCKPTPDGYSKGYHACFLLDGKAVTVPVEKPADAALTVAAYTKPASASAACSCSNGNPSDGCSDARCPVYEGSGGCLCNKPKAETTTAAVTTKTVAGHSHKCPKCSTVWTHADNDPNASHSCPSCGTKEYRQHNANVPVAVATPAKPKRVQSGGLYYDLYPNGTMIPCAACNKAAIR